MMRRWKVGLVRAQPAYRKRRRRALAAERKAQRRNRDATAALWPSQRSAWTASVPLPAGPALIVILLLSLGMWAMIGAAISLIISALS